MHNVLLEIGKSLLTLGNMLFALIFLKHYWDYRDLKSIILGAISFAVLYFIAVKFISKSEKEKKQ